VRRYGAMGGSRVAFLYGPLYTAPLHSLYRHLQRETAIAYGSLYDALAVSRAAAPP
jgi:hypothetical protein